MEFCTQCRRVTEGETIVVTDMLVTTLLCPFCGEDTIVEINEEPDNE